MNHASSDGSQDISTLQSNAQSGTAAKGNTTARPSGLRGRGAAAGLLSVKARSAASTTRDSSIAHTGAMTEPSDGLPVLVIDGAHFSDLDGFTGEFSRLLVNYTWRGNLDAFNDLLRGGFGTPENGWVLRWLNSELSRSALGYEATTQRLERVLLTCHPSHRLNIESRIRRARRGQGPTLFDEIVDIIREHGPGGRESEDSIVLELV